MIFALVGAVPLAAGCALWFSGVFRGQQGTAADAVADRPGAGDVAIDARLAAVIQAATAAAAEARADADAAGAVALSADKVATAAARFAAEGKAAAEKARKAAERACQVPSDRQGCAAAEDRTRYEGGQSCRAEGCGPDGYGVFSDARRGWESQGKWENWSLVLGCDSMNGVITYCGQQVESSWSGYGISYNARAAAISAEWHKGPGSNPIQLDYPTGSRMRGEMANYELDGLGVYERSDKRVLRGRWRAGKLISGVVSYPRTGDTVSGAFGEGNAQSGSIAYRDGRIFIGEIEDGPNLEPARPRLGALYAPDGRIEHQGSWRDGVAIADR